MSEYFLLLFFLLRTVSYTITTSREIQPEYMPYVGNGYIGHQIDSEYLYINGLYNGKLNTSDASELTHRAAIPNPFVFRYCEKPSSPFELSSNCSNGKIYERKIVLDDGIYIQHRKVLDREFREFFFAHRNEYNKYILQIELISGNEEKACLLFDSKFPNFDSQSDFGCDNYTIIEDSYPYIYVSINCKTKDTEIPEDITSSPHNFIFPLMNRTQCFDFSSTKTFFFLVDFDFSKSDLTSLYESTITLYEHHVSTWNSIFDSGFLVDEIEDDSKYQNIGPILQSSFYNVLSSLHPKIHFSTSPTTISNNHFHGHIFYDSELWILPTIFLFFRDFSWSMILYRLDRISSAKKIAEDNGFDGIQFPYSSSSVGLEASLRNFDGFDLSKEIHTNGDIAFIYRKWNILTGGTNKNFNYKQKIFDSIILPISEFWSSVVSSSGEIVHVIPHDEVTVNGELITVANSAYTNVVAQLSIFSAFAESLELKRFEEYEKFQKILEIGNNIKFPPLQKDSSGRAYIPEFQNFEKMRNISLKNVDSILISTPFQWSGMKNSYKFYSWKETEDHLEHYEDEFINNIEENGKFTSIMFSVLCMEYLNLWKDYKPTSSFGVSKKKKQILDKFKSRADDYFFKSFSDFADQEYNPFHVWKYSVRNDQNITNYISGSSAFLQSLLYGYIGINVDLEKHVFQFKNPTLIPGMKKFTLRNIQFENIVFNFEISTDKLSISLINGGGMFVCLTPTSQFLVKEGEGIMNSISQDVRQVISIGVSTHCYEPPMNPFLLFLIFFVLVSCAVGCCWCVICLLCFSPKIIRTILLRIGYLKIEQNPPGYYSVENQLKKYYEDNTPIEILEKAREEERRMLERMRFLEQAGEHDMEGEEEGYNDYGNFMMNNETEEEEEEEDVIID